MTILFLGSVSHLGAETVGETIALILVHFAAEVEMDPFGLYPVGDIKSVDWSNSRFAGEKLIIINIYFIPKTETNPMDLSLASSEITTRFFDSFSRLGAELVDEAVMN